MKASPLIRTMAIWLFAQLALCSCEAEEACSRYEDVCPSVPRALCTQLLDDQSNDENDELSQCIQDAKSCYDIHQCLGLD